MPVVKVVFDMCQNILHVTCNLSVPVWNKRSDDKATSKQKINALLDPYKLHGWAASGLISRPEIWYDTEAEPPSRYKHSAQLAWKHWLVTWK